MDNFLDKWVRGAVLVVALFFVFGVVTEAVAAEYTVTLTWNPTTTNTDGSPITDLGGYVVYYGPASLSYVEQLDVGNVTTFQWLIDVEPGSTQYFNVSAYDTSGNSSDYNGEVAFTFPLLPDPPPSAPSGLTVTLP